MSRLILPGVLGVKKKDEYALQFDGMDDSVSMSSSSINGISCSFWIKLNEIKRMGVMSGIFPDNYIIFIDNTNGIGASLPGAGSNVSDFNFSINQWYHIVIINFQHGQVNEDYRIYVDNNKIGLTPKSGWRLNSQLVFGGVNANLPYNGALTKVNVWDRIITETEILQLYSNKNKLITDGLIARWDFNEGDGCILNDTSVNSRNGTLQPNCPTNSPTWIQL